MPNSKGPGKKLVSDVDETSPFIDLAVHREKITTLSERVVAVEQSNKEQDERIGRIETSINVLVEKVEAFMLRVDTGLCRTHSEDISTIQEKVKELVRDKSWFVGLLTAIVISAGGSIGGGLWWVATKNASQDAAITHESLIRADHEKNMKSELDKRPTMDKLSSTFPSKSDLEKLTKALEENREQQDWFSDLPERDQRRFCRGVKTATRETLPLKVKVICQGL